MKNNLIEFFKTEKFDNVVKIAEIIKANTGDDVYLVGWCVRDILLWHDPNDIDIAWPTDPYVIADILGGSVTEKLWTVFFTFWDEDIEYTPFRIESDYNGRSPETVRFSKNLEDDAIRRDFTMNSVYINVLTQETIDLHWWVSDINKWLIRAVWNPYDRFNEDFLRIFRAVRFSSKFWFEIEDETYRAMIESSDWISGISKYRTYEELKKGIYYPGYIRMLSETNLLRFINAEFANMYWLKQNTVHHAYDVMEHVLRTVEASLKYFPNKHINFHLSALFHDLWKPLQFSKTSEFEYGTVAFYQAKNDFSHEKVWTDIFISWLGSWQLGKSDYALTNEEIWFISDIITNHQNEALFRDMLKSDRRLALNKMKKLIVDMEFNEDRIFNLIDFAFCDKIWTGTISLDYANEIRDFEYDLYKEAISSETLIWRRELAVSFQWLRDEFWFNSFYTMKMIERCYDAVIDWRVANTTEKLMKFVRGCDIYDDRNYDITYNGNLITYYETLSEELNKWIPELEALSDTQISKIASSWSISIYKSLATSWYWESTFQAKIDNLDKFWVVDWKTPYLIISHSKAIWFESLDKLKSFLISEVKYLRRR